MATVMVSALVCAVLELLNYYSHVYQVALRLCNSQLCCNLHAHEMLTIRL